MENVLGELQIRILGELRITHDGEGLGLRRTIEERERLCGVKALGMFTASWVLLKLLEASTSFGALPLAARLNLGINTTPQEVIVRSIVCLQLHDISNALRVGKESSSDLSGFLRQNRYYSACIFRADALKGDDLVEARRG